MVYSVNCGKNGLGICRKQSWSSNSKIIPDQKFQHLKKSYNYMLFAICFKIVKGWGNVWDIGEMRLALPYSDCC